MKKFYIIFLGLCIFSSCSEPSAPRANSQELSAKGIVSRDKMINLLKEIHLAESVVSSSGLTHKKSLARFKRYKSFIFKKYNMDSITFNTNFEYYMGNKQDLEYIYQALEDTFLLRKHHKNFD